MSDHGGRRILHTTATRRVALAITLAAGLSSGLAPGTATAALAKKPQHPTTTTTTRATTSTSTTSTTSTTVPVASQAVAYQGDPAHTGSQAADTLTPQLQQRWSLNLGGAISYPLVAGGRVFVTVANPSAYGTSLSAFDLATGARAWGPVDLGGTYWWSAPAYDNGKVFALNYDGLLRAFGAASGAPLWTTQLPGQRAFSSAPTAANGLVYTGGAGSGGTVYAVDQVTGAVRWTMPVANGDDSSPAVTGQGVYVSYACQQAYAFDPITGAQLWHHATGCSGGGGKTAAVSGKGVYVRDSGNVVLDAATGAVTGSFSATPIPALDAGRGYFLNGGTLEAHDLATGTVLWSFVGDGTLVSAPLVANGYVYVGSGAGKVFAVSASTGALASTTTVGAPIQAPDEQNVSQPLTGMAIGAGHLVVPASGTLTAYAS